MRRLILISLIFLTTGEVFLRLTWPNPYRLPAPDAYIHHPGMHLKYHHLDRVYEGAPDPVFFNTAPLGFIENRTTRQLDLPQYPGPFAVAFGGSTTESATVQENRRWTDLLRIPTLNYGKSRMFSVNSFFAMKHVLEEQRLRPRLVLVMQGVNDLSRFMKKGPGHFDPERYEYIVINRPIDFIVKNFFMAAFAWRFWKQTDYHGFYLSEAQKSRAFPVMTEPAFEGLIAGKRESLAAALEVLYARMKELTRRHESQLIVITESDSFRPDYRPRGGEDLRTFPVYDGRRCTVEQAGHLMDLYREALILAASRLQIPVIDGARCFSGEDVSGLIYDAFHFTEEGSHRFAECLNRNLEKFL